jgi:heat shock protein HspQ
MRIDNKITGAVFRHVNVDIGPSYTNPKERVVEVSLKSNSASNSTNLYVLSKTAAKELVSQIQEALLKDKNFVTDHPELPLK